MERPTFVRACLFSAWMAAAASSEVAAGSEVAPPSPFGPVPSERQLRWHELEYYGFVHFTVNAFTDREWGNGDESPSIFNPSAMDVRQWARVARDAGMKGLIITAKHHDGFCLWPSRHTEHSVKNAPWKGGKGDVVRELADACREHGLMLGVYLSPWDRNHAEYARPAYIEYYRHQLKELLSSYGPIFEVWFDGANGGTGYYGGAREERRIDQKTYYDWENTWKIVRDLQPMAVMFSDAGPDIRWVGNESGVAAETCWAKVRPEGTYPGIADTGRLTSGDPDGTVWRPAEVDVSIRPGWFYHASEDGKVKSLEHLLAIYYSSVGMGCNLLLNIPPDRRGRFHERDAARLLELRAALDATFSVDLAAGKPVTASATRGGSPAFAAGRVTDGDRRTYWATGDDVREAALTVDLGAPTTFNRARLQEHIALGQRIARFAIDARAGGEWKEIARGTTIGPRRILRFADVTADQVRLRITEAQACPTISTFELYRAPAANAPAPKPPAAKPAAANPAPAAPAAQAQGRPRYRVEYATYLGGAAWDQAREAIVYPDGSVLVGAQTCSEGMPITPGAAQPRYAGDDPALGHGGVYGGDCYLARLAPDGRSVLAATYFGGSKQERNVYGMGLDSAGNVIIATATRSTDAPTTPGCFQRAFGGGPSDMLVAKLSADLKKLLWCTYVGGSGDDFPRGGLAVDSQDCVHVVGTSASSDFPTTPGVLGPRLNGPRDSAIVKLKADGSGLIFGTLLGGTGEDDAIMGVRLDASGNLHLAGHTKSADFPVTAGAPQAKLGGESDCYLAKLSPDAKRLVYATYLGGSGNEFAEHCPLLAADGSLLLAGFCGSADFPTTPGAFQQKLGGKGDGFLTRLSADGSTWVLSTLLGGSGGENLLMPCVDSQGNIHVVGNTSSADFPVTPDAIQKGHRGGDDAVLAIFSPDGSKLLYATYFGGSGDEMFRSLALGPHGELYLVGSTSSDDFPVTPGALQARHAGAGDAFVVKLVPETAATGGMSPLPVRGIHLAAPAKRDLPALLQFIRDILPKEGVNTLILEFNYSFDYTSRPEFADQSALGKDEVKQIAAACREKGIELIPQINCLGHQSWSKRTARLLEKHPEFDETPGKYPGNEGIYCRSYCPLHPEVHAVLFDLVDELARACEATSFHVGMDEVFILADPDCPRCKGKDPADLFAGEVRRLEEHLKGIGCRMWMWGDRFIDGQATGIGKWEASTNGTTTAIDTVPKDIVICDWHYEKAHETPQFFAAKGFPVVACPWRKADVALRELAHIRAIRANADAESAARGLGVVQTTWCGFGAFEQAYRRLSEGAEPVKGSASEAAQCFRALFAAVRAETKP